jgi:predicted HTH transcriptional regulator
VNLEEQQILELCKSKGRVTNKDLQNLLGIHRNTATNRLKRMLSGKLLVRYGNGKSTFYAPNFKLG